MLKVIIFLALLIGLSYCRSVVFSVIAFGKKTQIVVGSKKYTLPNPTSTEPLFRGKLSNASDDAISYYYIVDGVKENFTRTLEPGLTKTYNDFYGREKTIQKLETFSYPNSNWNRSIGKTNLFDDSYIPTIHLTGNNTQAFFKKPTKSAQRIEKFTFYLKDEVYSFKNVPVTAKNRDFEKFQFKISVGQANAIHGRFLLKFRNGSEDPTNLRQTIYGNMLQAVGAPAIHSVMVRVYVNKTPVGFYTMQEEAFSDSFIRAEFYGNPKDETINAPSPIGYALDCSTGSDFEYQPLNMSYYDPFVVKSGESIAPLLKFTYALDQLDTKDEDAVAEFEDKWFDLDSFYKAMALEYLTADWDAYWHFTSNFAFYDDPTQSTATTYKFYFISQDHDETFGVGIHEPHNMVGFDYPKQSYTTMLKEVWHYDEYDAFHRTLVDKFIGSTPALQKRFQDILIEIVRSIFNPVSFGRVLDSMVQRYRPEVEWDYSFERPYQLASQPTNWNLASFDQNINDPIDGILWGLKQFVSLRAEALKNEFCITWNGDSNPPPSSCVPYQIPGSGSSVVKTTTTPPAQVITTTTQAPVITTTTTTTTTTKAPVFTTTKTFTKTTTIYTTRPAQPTQTPNKVTEGKPILEGVRDRLKGWLNKLFPFGPFNRDD